MSRKGISIGKLRLTSLGSGGGSGASSSRSNSPTSCSSSTERARSAPATMRDVPRCPSCRDESGTHVRKLRYWMKRQTWVWHCSAETPSSDGTGAGFCGVWFAEDRPRAVCNDCGSAVRLLMVGGEASNDFYFYCSKCKLKDNEV